MTYKNKVKSTVTCGVCGEETTDYVLGIPRHGKPKWVCKKHVADKEVSK